MSYIRGYKMVKKVIITFSDEEVEKLETLAQRVNLSRNKLVQQICRKHLGLPSLLNEEEG